jgi:oligopeptide transport system permease protein
MKKNIANPPAISSLLYNNEIKKSYSFWQDAKRRFIASPSFITGITLLVIIFAIALIGPIISSHSYYAIHLPLKNIAPSSHFWFGSDELGRDVFTRACCGCRISLLVGITAAIIDVFIGVIIGTIAATSSKTIDNLLMRACDIISAIPNLLTVILLLVVLGPGLTTIIISLTITGWINMARIVRGQVLQLKEMDFIVAAKSIGASNIRIIVKHMLPNCMNVIIATLTLTIPTAIFAEAFLSFLGLGIQAPIASCGVMISDSLSALYYYPWRIFFPSIMIIFTMLGFNLVGDGITDALDPRMRL